MPKNTFFNLPEAKRQLLLNSCWEEFTRVSYADASINRIVQQAHIPRGSFYQYFENKEDAFQYLLLDISTMFWDTLRPYFRANPTDLTSALQSAFDMWFLTAGPLESGASRALQLLRVNPFLDWFQVLSLNPASEGQYSPVFSLACCAFCNSCKQAVLSPETTQTLREKLSALLQRLCCSGRTAYF